MTHLPRVLPAAAIAALTVSAFALAVSPITALAAAPQPFLPDVDITSTIPANGDLNP
jgi:hypothetical protein